MKKFLLKLILLLLIIFLLDKLLYFLLDYFPKTQYDKRLQYLLDDQIKSDIIILGSSRASRDILAESLQKHLNLSCYNLGYPGSNIEFHTFLLKNVIRLSHKPHIVLLVLDDPHEFIENSDLNFRWDRIYPLIKFQEMNHLLIRETGKRRLLSALMVSIRIKENIPQNLIKVPPSSLEILDTNGSMPIAGYGKEWNALTFSKGDTAQYVVENESERLRSSFLEFVNLCKSNQIDLLFVYPPNYRPQSRTFIQRIKMLADDIDSFSYDQEFYSDKKYFYNEGHLNKFGADIFTLTVAEFLKKCRKL